MNIIQHLTNFFFKTNPTQTNHQGQIISAKITDISKHPNADRLSLVQLTDGHSVFGPVVCGATNLTLGDIVALALPGATIAKNIHTEAHESFVLQPAKIRGIESQGMICAEFELGLTEEIGEKPEIYILPKDTKLGTIIA